VFRRSCSERSAAVPVGNLVWDKFQAEKHRPDTDQGEDDGRFDREFGTAHNLLSIQESFDRPTG